MAGDTLRDLRREAKRHRIFVNPTKYNGSHPGNVPDDHRPKFENIQTLGRLEYTTYGLQPSPDTPDKPWQHESKKRAAKLVHIAGKCRRENRNEAGWRYEVESRLFERFDVEVAW